MLFGSGSASSLSRLSSLPGEEGIQQGSPSLRARLQAAAGRAAARALSGLAGKTSADTPEVLRPMSTMGQSSHPQPATATSRVFGSVPPVSTNPLLMQVQLEWPPVPLG